MGLFLGARFFRIQIAIVTLAYWVCFSAFAAEPRVLCETKVENEIPKINLTDSSSLHDSLNAVKSCGESVQNCLKSIAPSLPGLVLDTDKSMALLLNQHEAQRVVASAKSNDVKEVALQYNNVLAKLVGYLSLEESRQSLEGELEKVEQDPDAASLKLIWARMARTAELCDKLVDLDRRSVGGVALGSPLARERLENLFCAMRLKKEFDGTKLLSNWPGAVCGNDEGYGSGPNKIVIGKSGRVIDGVCVDHAGVNLPIDERVPSGVAHFVNLLKAKLARRNLELTKVNFIGCGLARVERGENVTTGVLQNKKFGLHHVSDHSRGLGCDINGLEYKDAQGLSHKFDMASMPGEKKNWFADALERFAPEAKQIKENEQQRSIMDLQYPVVSGKKHSKVAVSGVEEFYENVDQALADSSSEKITKIESRYPKEFFAGIAMRAALSEAGFLVFDSTTNSVHRDHFHFEVPSERDLADELTTTSYPAKKRDQLLKTSIQRASGAVDATTLEP